MEIQRDNNTDNSTVLKLRDGNVSPNNTPRDHNSVTGARYRSTSDYSPLMKYLLSGQLSKDCRTPPNRQMIGYQHNKSGLSGNNGGFSSHGSSSPLSVFTLPAVDGMERLPLRSQLSQAVKIDEDVLVMDGILVGSVAGGGRLRQPATSDSGRSLSLSYSSGGSLYKSEICRFWEASGTCHFGLKCQFAHGKEELRLAHFANRNTAEASTLQSFHQASIL
ncbi:hypothetical protein Nepgr_019778 [Nepenthes gracilis]|uniref:C3H1-type domain-containing protein n=1 Tax=Nepenthes gracilis TaxID=150966 RepID=A0AAD3XUF5_NEPGR|nr:hypothetical protein Nepgr_019778 [Nepenthes gracilis]